MSAVHSPFNSDPRFAPNYRDKGKPPVAQAYATLTEGMDKSLGDPMDHVAAKGVAENTLFIFLGDNGGDCPFGPLDDVAACAPLRGRKGAKWEGGMRVPFIVAWAKRDATNAWQKRLSIPAESIRQEVGTCYDLLPTIGAFVGVPAPADHHVDGQVLLRLLAGQSDPKHRNEFLNHYGDAYAKTPNFDKLAEESIRYTNAHAVAPVCSVSRSSIVTGMYPSTIGRLHHRSGGVPAPAFLKFVPNITSEAGYYTTNHKGDYNIVGMKYDMQGKQGGDTPWRSRPDKSQPFFSKVDSGECDSSVTKTPENVIVKARLNRLKPGDFHDPAEAPIPSFHPDDPVFRTAWARYCDAVTQVECRAGEVIAALKEDVTPMKTSSCAKHMFVWFSGFAAGERLHRRNSWRVPLRGSSRSLQSLRTEPTSRNTPTSSSSSPTTWVTEI